jgi:hypothetical protein
MVELPAAPTGSVADLDAEVMTGFGDAATVGGRAPLFNVTERGVGTAPTAPLAASAYVFERQVK